MSRNNDHKLLNFIDKTPHCLLSKFLEASGNQDLLKTMQQPRSRNCNIQWYNFGNKYFKNHELIVYYQNKD